MLYIIDCIVAFIIFMDTNFLSVIPVGDFAYSVMGYKNKVLLTIICVLMFVFSLLYRSYYRKKITYNFSGFILLLVGITIVLTIYSAEIYDQSITAGFKMSYYFMIPLIYYLFTLYFSTPNRVKYFTNLMVFMGTIYSGIIILQVLLLKVSSIIFLNFNEQGLGLLEYRSYGIRLSKPADFITLSFLFTCLAIYSSSRKKNVLLYSAVFIQFIYISLVSMTRLSMIICVALFVLTMIFKTDLKSKIKSRVYVLLLLLIAGLFGGEIINNLLYGQQDRMNSALIRTDAIQYFRNQMFSHGVFGRGFPTDAKYYFFNHGPEGTLFTTDLGVYGFITIYGVAGIIIVMLLLYKLVQAYLRTRGDRYNRGMITLVLVYLLLSAPTLFLFDAQRILYLPILLSLIDMFILKANSSIELDKYSL